MEPVGETLITRKNTWMLESLHQEGESTQQSWGLVSSSATSGSYVCCSSSLLLLLVPRGVIQNGARVRSQALFPVIRPLPVSPVGSRTSAIRWVNVGPVAVSLTVGAFPSHLRPHALRPGPGSERAPNFSVHRLHDYNFTVSKSIHTHRTFYPGVFM